MNVYIRTWLMIFVMVTVVLHLDRDYTTKGRWMIIAFMMLLTTLAEVTAYLTP